MPFRDDEDARLARLASLENENEDLREELEETRRANEKLVAERERLARAKPTDAIDTADAEPAPPAAAPDKPSESRKAPPKPRAGWLRHWPRLLIIAAVIAAAVVAVRCAVKLGQSRTIVGIAYLDGALSVEIVTSWTGRRPRPPKTQLVTFDLTSGARLGSIELGRTDVTYPASGTRAWVKLGEGKLALVDVRVPAIVIPPGELARHIPELAAGFELRADEGLSTVTDGAVADHETRTPDAIPLVLADGSRAWLDPEPRLVRVPPRAAVRNPIGYACFFYDAPSCEQRRCFTWVGSEATTTRRLGWRWPWDKQSTLVGPDPSALHAPEFVKRLDRRCAVEIDGGLLVRHESSALEPKHRLLSLVASDGTLRWTRRVDELAGNDAMPVGAMVAGDRIHLLLGDAWGRESMALRDFRSKRLVLVHLSATTGETLATHPLL